MHVRADVLTKYLPEVDPSVIFHRRIGDSIRIDRFGKVECLRRAPADTITASLSRISRRHLALRFQGVGRNPCSPPGVTPDIDFDLTVEVRVAEDRRSARLDISGGVDEFPSFEMYSSANGRDGDAVTLFRRRASDSPFDLFGGAVRGIKVSQVIEA
jgi:hypothetical protein